MTTTEALPGPVLDLVLDLRRAEAGQVVGTRRLGSSQEVWTRLPWLVLASGGVEVVVVRTLHQKETRTFRQAVERHGCAQVLAHRRTRAQSLGERG